MKQSAPNLNLLLMQELINFCHIVRKIINKGINKERTSSNTITQIDILYIKCVLNYTIKNVLLNNIPYSNHIKSYFEDDFLNLISHDQAIIMFIENCFLCFLAHYKLAIRKLFELNIEEQNSLIQQATNFSQERLEYYLNHSIQNVKNFALISELYDLFQSTINDCKNNANTLQFSSSKEQLLFIKNVIDNQLHRTNAILLIKKALKNNTQNIDDDHKIYKFIFCSINTIYKIVKNNLHRKHHILYQTAFNLQESLHGGDMFNFWDHNNRFLKQCFTTYQNQQSLSYEEIIQSMIVQESLNDMQVIYR